MKGIVPRTCTEIPTDADRHRQKEPRPLTAFRDESAYVLLGDPGAGKTTAFAAECEALDDACLITARDFLTFDSQCRPEWRKKTLFIDGLDEVRVGADDARTPFDRIRGRLEKLGNPRFRLSCREADWLGANDRRHLESVAPNSQVMVLRLNPLTNSDVAQILKTHRHIDDAAAFMVLAQERGVDGLLANPQTLDLLAKAVAGGGWPESRKETFEMACEQMVREHNEEHEVAQAAQPAPDQLLDAAGRLCAVQLISGAAGYALRGQPDADYPTLDQCERHYDRREVLRSALATKLFKGASNNRFTPVHRHIAEFLGARHLAGLIDSGLPARRAIALIVGGDGGVVTEMRGLSAWLAAHCKDARADLIERDPIGVGLYGDIREFYTDEKRTLLESLNREASRLDSSRRTAAAFGALATPDLEPVLKTILTDSRREEKQQLIADFALCVLREGSPLPSLSDLLLEIVRDDTWWPHVNHAALDAFIDNCPHSEDKVGKLKALLADIQSGDVPDPDSELLGTLLIRLYPQDLPPSEVWGYLSGEGILEHFHGRYRGFWEVDLLEKASDEQVAELLNNLKERLPNLQSALGVLHLHDLLLKLLARGLQAHGDQLDTESLYDWLGVGVIKGGYSQEWDDEAIRGEIRAWLKQRPEVQKAVLAEGLARCRESDEFSEQVSQAFNHLYGGRPPDFGLWCLKQAVAMADAKPRVAKHLLEGAFNEGLSLDVLREHTRPHETLKAHLDQLLSPPSIPPKALKGKRKASEYTQEQIREDEIALRENRAAPARLYLIAHKYFGNFTGGDGRSALAELCQGDPRLIEAALEGLRGAIDREDVPDIGDILGLRKEGRLYYLGLPFLAGLAEVERTVPEENPSQWDDSRVRKAVAFYYCTPHAIYSPKWYRRLLEARPQIVAEVQVQFAICEFRGGREHIYKLWELAHDPDHAQVAQYASLPLLRAFPTRCKLNQLSALDQLLWAAIQQADRTALAELIDQKQSRPSMNLAQRVHWLAAGVIVSPRAYSDLLRDSVQEQNGRIRHLTAFFFTQDDLPFRFLNKLGIPTWELLIRLVGSYVEPESESFQEGGYSPEDPKFIHQFIHNFFASRRAGSNGARAQQFIHQLIHNLSASPAKDASDALDRLLAEPRLSRWHYVLSRAQDAQRVTWRDAGYRHPTIEQVCRTLNSGTPANAGDLAALVMDRLRELADQIRSSNTDDWRQYWNLDSYRRPKDPRPENSCRDALLSDLRLLLPQGVDAQPEGQYANDKRADIRVSYGGFQVPVEIKKNNHLDLWSALQKQLIPKYTSAPDADGYGIYLVFWFGKKCTQSPPSGPPPADAKELKERLEATLSPDEARKISVCVIDVRPS